MKTIEVEIYYGYYLGDAQMWDTEYVEIPGDTPEEKYEEIAKGVFQERMCIKSFGYPTIAFWGLHSVDQDQFYDEDELPTGVDAVCENCGNPCEYDSKMCLCDKCQKKFNS